MNNASHQVTVSFDMLPAENKNGFPEEILRSWKAFNLKCSAYQVHILITMK